MGSEEGERVADLGREVVAGPDRVGMDTRVSWTFTPTMTFEAYINPFIATGHYSEFAEYAAPRTKTLLAYGADRGTITAVNGANGLVDHYTVDPDGAGPAASFNVSNPDFNSISLRGNAVFRWEWRPGSTLFVAWQQNRQDRIRGLGDFDFSRDVRALSARRSRRQGRSRHTHHR